MLLPSKLPNARILTFGYDASVVNWRAMVSQNTIGNHAKNLLATLATHRENDNTVSTTLSTCFREAYAYKNHLPIIFIAHSLGGLVCEDVGGHTRSYT